MTEIREGLSAYYLIEEEENGGAIHLQLRKRRRLLLSGTLAKRKQEVLRIHGYDASPLRRPVRVRVCIAMGVHHGDGGEG